MPEAPDPFPAAAFHGRSIAQLGAFRTHLCDFIESLYAYGCSKGVIWSEPSTQIINSVLGKLKSNRASSVTFPSPRLVSIS